MLFSLAVIKIVQSNRGVFKSFAINQSESSFNSHGIFNKLFVNQSELSSTSHGFSTVLISFVDINDSFTGSICGNNQSE